MQIILQDKQMNVLHEMKMDIAPHVIHWRPRPTLDQKSLEINDAMDASLGIKTEAFVRFGIQEGRAFYEPATEAWI